MKTGWKMIIIAAMVAAVIAAWAGIWSAYRQGEFKVIYGVDPQVETDSQKAVVQVAVTKTIVELAVRVADLRDEKCDAPDAASVQECAKKTLGYLVAVETALEKAEEAAICYGYDDGYTANAMDAYRKANKPYYQPAQR